MEDKIISKKDFKSLIIDLAGRYRVFVPVKRDESSAYEEIYPRTFPEEGISFTYSNTKKGIKEFFLPQRERLFSFNLLKKDEIKVPDQSDRKRIIIGVRPCDAKGIDLFDKVFFCKEYHDPYYRQKRENTLVIAMGCNAPDKTCFCISTGGDPFATDGSDLLLVDLEDSFLVQPVTEKGINFLDQESVFLCAEQSQIQRKEQSFKDARSSIKSQLDTKKIKINLDKNFDDPLWDRIYAKCLGCGVCTYFCPTCHCFDILDETQGLSGERIRIWDSCMFPQFTLHASGANPRPTGKERLRQ